MVSTRPLLRLGFLLLAAGAQIGTCSSQAVLLDASGGGLVPLLERNAYGPAGPNALIGETARGPVFQPSTAQDHLATHFVQLSKGFLRRATVALRVDGLPPDWPLTIQIQNQAYEVIGNCDSNCTVAVDSGYATNAVRLVFLSRDGRPGLLPAQVALTAGYDWDRALIGWGVKGVAAIIFLAVGFGYYRSHTGGALRLLGSVRDWTDRHAPEHHALEPRPRKRWYWICTAVVIGCYALVWIVNFKYVYGWLEDDWCTYLKGLATLEDPKDAFLVRANLLQPYFFLFSYLPLALGLRLPSIPIPVFGNDTGLFRGLLLFTMCYHLVIALSWAWWAEKLSGRRSAAFLSTVFLLLSPEYVLWTPQPDTRIVGLPLVLMGMWLLLRGPEAKPLHGFFAGVLFSVANNLHYTSMYLTVPAMLVFFGLDAMRRWYRKEFWRTWLGFAAGLGGVVAGLELLSHYWVGRSFNNGVLASLFSQFETHGSTFPRSQIVQTWAEFANNLIGLPMLLAGVAGMAILIRRRASIALVTICCLGGALILLSGSTPFFRQTSLLQPFLFLYAAVAITECASLVKPTALRTLSLVGLAAVVTAIPAARAYETFQAHLGLGRTLHWVEEHKGNRRICWLFKRVAEYLPKEYLSTYSPDDWVVVRFSWFSSELAGPLSGVRPLASFPGIWGTEICYAETFAWNHSDLRKNSFVSQTRVYRVGDLTAALRNWNHSSQESGPLRISRIDPIPDSEAAMDRQRLMKYYIPLPDPVGNPRVWVLGKGFGRYSVLTLDGRPIPTRVDDFHTVETRLIAAIPANIRGCVEASVQDGPRRSNSVHLCVSR
ncbi:MAG TPA: glycosyltransferase family 39 protein [Candidatus Solibacter sp.]|nr:glycosyltransferase family 39 protein [Candidatus Solibacter sp.]